MRFLYVLKEISHGIIDEEEYEIIKILK